jgi:hypothetical protein
LVGFTSYANVGAREKDGRYGKERLAPPLVFRRDKQDAGFDGQLIRQIVRVVVSSVERITMRLELDSRRASETTSKRDELPRPVQPSAPSVAHIFCLRNVEFEQRF